MTFFQGKFAKVLYFTTIFLVFDCLVGSVLIEANAQQKKGENKSKDGIYGLPHNRRDGGSRSNCLANGRDMVALVPNSPINKTASASPELLFYVPQAEETKEIEFVLRDRADNLVYKTLMPTGDRAGIMSVSIPEAVKENAKGSQNDYHWYLSLICNSSKRSQDIVLEGWIQYVQLNQPTQEKISLSNSIEKSDLLQEAGIWYDAISVLAEQKKSNSNINTVQAEWSEILESIDLSNLASEPLIEVEAIHK